MKRKQTANKPITRKPTRQYPTRTDEVRVEEKTEEQQQIAKKPITRKPTRQYPTRTEVKEKAEEQQQIAKKPNNKKIKRSLFKLVSRRKRKLNKRFITSLVVGESKRFPQMFGENLGIKEHIECTHSQYLSGIEYYNIRKPFLRCLVCKSVTSSTSVMCTSGETIKISFTTWQHCRDEKHSKRAAFFERICEKFSVDPDLFKKKIYLMEGANCIRSEHVFPMVETNTRETGPFTLMEALGLDSSYLDKDFDESQLELFSASKEENKTLFFSAIDKVIKHMNGEDVDDTSESDISSLKNDTRDSHVSNINTTGGDRNECNIGIGTTGGGRNGGNIDTNINGGDGNGGNSGTDTDGDDGNGGNIDTDTDGGESDSDDLYLNQDQLMNKLNEDEMEISNEDLDVNKEENGLIVSNITHENNSVVEEVDQRQRKNKRKYSFTCDNISTGGLPTDGLPTDGLPTDGLPTDGLPTDGLLTGGLPTGGLSIGGLPTGLPTGGLPTGDLPTDDLPTGGLPTGGLLTGVGGLSTGGLHTGLPTDLPTGDFHTGLPTGNYSPIFPRYISNLSGDYFLGDLSASDLYCDDFPTGDLSDTDIVIYDLSNYLSGTPRNEEGTKNNENNRKDLSREEARIIFQSVANEVSYREKEMRSKEEEKEICESVIKKIEIENEKHVQDGVKLRTLFVEDLEKIKEEGKILDEFFELRSKLMRENQWDKLEQMNVDITNQKKIKDNLEEEHGIVSREITSLNDKLVRGKSKLVHYQWEMIHLLYNMDAAYNVLHKLQSDLFNLAFGEELSGDVSIADIYDNVPSTDDLATGDLSGTVTIEERIENNESDGKVDNEVNLSRNLVTGDLSGTFVIEERIENNENDGKVDNGVNVSRSEISLDSHVIEKEEKEIRDKIMYWKEKTTSVVREIMRREIRLYKVNNKHYEHIEKRKKLVTLLREQRQKTREEGKKADKLRESIWECWKIFGVNEGTLEKAKPMEVDYDNQRKIVAESKEEEASLMKKIKRIKRRSTKRVERFCRLQSSLIELLRCMDYSHERLIKLKNLLYSLLEKRF